MYIENEKEACSLVVDELPTKTDYILGEELDLTGAKVSGFFTDGEQLFELKNADLQELIDDGTITLDADAFYNYGQKSGSRSINIGYYNAYTSFSVNVIDPNEGYHIELISPPDKLTYNLGEELDLTGATVSGVVYYGGFHGDIFTSDASIYIENGLLKLDVSEFDNTKPGTYTINLILGHDSLFPDTESFEVTVNDENIVITGDANGDGDFTIADMVIVQKHIMGKKTAVLSDWKCADLYEDGKIDVYDFIVMRENFVKNMK